MSKSKKTKFPRTRYQGSKYKLTNWINDSLESLEFKTVLDAFSGTSSVGYMFKQIGKEVYSNDILPFNFYVSKSMIENKSTLVTENDFENILIKKTNYKYKTFIQDTFKDIYYLDSENEWLDIVVQNILDLKDEYKKSMFFWALFQSCISKRPYNLFHRKNLYVRTAEVERSFGNKTTWDKNFEEHFKKFIDEINLSIFDNGKNNKSYCMDVFDLEVNADLVYIDSPYIPLKGSKTTYGDFYHFLSGMVEYDSWEDNIDYKSKNKKLVSDYSIWEDKKNILDGFEKLIEKFKGSKIVISYRSDGIPSVEEISNILIRYGKKVTINTIDYNYVLSNKKDLKEVLIIGV